MWAWGPDKHARFWPRRLLHETAVHRGDAYLLMWGRRTITDDRFTAAGDIGLLTYWAANSSL